MEDEPTLAAVREHGVRLLARREHSVLELRRKLSRKGHPADLIEQALEQLQDERLLSDRRFAEAYARSRREQGYGPVRIQAELRERGVDARVDALLDDEDDSTWVERAARAREKRFGALPDSLKERERQYRFLAQRGFASDQIRRALAGASADPDTHY